MLSIALLGGCEASKTGLAEASVKEQRAETAIESLEQLPARTPEQDALLAQFRTLEREYEKQRQAFEAVQAPELMRRGLETGTQVATGNWFGALEGVLTLLGAAGLAFGGKKLSDRTTGKKLTDLEDRLERTLVPQGIAGLKASSAETMASDVARAVKAQRDAEVRAAAVEAQREAVHHERLNRMLALQAQGVPTYSAPIVPITPAPAPAAPVSEADALLAQLRSEYPEANAN